MPCNMRRTDLYCICGNICNRFALLMTYDGNENNSQTNRITKVFPSFNCINVRGLYSSNQGTGIRLWEVIGEVGISEYGVRKIVTLSLLGL